jgi:predicted MPP superfamily phosphohydrolase
MTPASLLDTIACAAMHSFGVFHTRDLARVTETELIVEDLGAGFDGYTIAALADFHHHPSRLDLRWLRHVVDATNSASPDLVALLGDYGASFKRTPVMSQRWYRAALAAMTPDLGRLRARDGVVAVLGNHDYYASAALVREWLESIGAALLINRARYLLRSGSTLCIAGMDDLSEGNADPLVGCDPAERAPTVVLSHHPDGILHLDPRIRVDAMLAGHTHGGQMVLPGYGAPITMSRACGRQSANGWVANGRAPLYVSRGIGEQLPLPLRFRCPPEVVVLRLRRARQQPA